MQLNLDFHDLSGNLTNPNQPTTLAPIQVGYTDDLIGLSQWHSVTAAFDFPSGQPQLQIIASFSMTLYLPGFGQSYDGSHQSALSHYENYISLYYQMQEPGLEQFAVTTSVGQVDSSLTTRQESQLALLGFVSQIYLFLSAAKDLEQVFPPIAEGTLLGALATTYAVTVSDIMTANKAVDLVGQLFAEGTTLNIPTYYIVKSGDTLTDILEKVSTTQLEQNDQLLLNAGTAVNIPPQTFTVRSDITFFADPDRK